jgi:hypothetical protein
MDTALLFSLSLSGPLKKHQNYSNIYFILWPVCIVAMAVKALRSECNGLCG